MRHLMAFLRGREIPVPPKEAPMEDTPFISVYPSFFPDFACKADKCRHTCCQTWEIDIDPDTEAMYRAEKGPLGEKLRKAMKKSPDGSVCFALNEKGYCPLLTEKGLCSLVLEKGDDFLCQICRDHPRFYKYLGDFELCGTGLACERTAEQLLEETGPLRFCAGDTDFPLESFLLSIIPGFPAEDLAFRPDFRTEPFLRTLARLEQTEPIDDRWTEDLTALKKKAPALSRRAEALFAARPEFWCNLFRYILFRELDRLQDYAAETVLAFAAENTVFIVYLAALSRELIPSVCRWSEQIEYDTDNVDILLPLIEKEICHA